MRRRLATILGTLGAVCLVAFSATSAERKSRQELVPRFAGPEIVEKLKAGGTVVLIRHMTTVRSPDQWGGVDYDDCTTQRVLSDVGKQQAIDLGRAFKNLGIPVGKVIVSPYCRCRETAELAFGKPGEQSETLSVWDELEMEEKTARGTEIRKMLDTPPEPGTNTVLVTHTGNLLWSFGLDSKPEGLAHVFKPTGLSIGRATYLGRVNPDDWRSLAGLEEPKPADAAAAEEAPAE
jgi:phosphohistidine phosphatase SixA